MFTHRDSDLKEGKAHALRVSALHARVHYCQDQVTLASYHKRPQVEIALLLQELREAIKTSKEG